MSALSVRAAAIGSDVIGELHLSIARFPRVNPSAPRRMGEMMEAVANRHGLASNVEITTDPDLFHITRIDAHLSGPTDALRAAELAIRGAVDDFWR